MSEEKEIKLNSEEPPIKAINENYNFVII